MRGASGLRCRSCGVPLPAGAARCPSCGLELQPSMFLSPPDAPAFTTTAPAPRRRRPVVSLAAAAVVAVVVAGLLLSARDHDRTGSGAPAAASAPPALA